MTSTILLRAVGEICPQKHNIAEEIWSALLFPEWFRASLKLFLKKPYDTKQCAIFVSNYENSSSLDAIQTGTWNPIPRSWKTQMMLLLEVTHGMSADLVLICITNTARPEQGIKYWLPHDPPPCYNNPVIISSNWHRFVSCSLTRQVIVVPGRQSTVAKYYRSTMLIGTISTGKDCNLY